MKQNLPGWCKAIKQIEIPADQVKTSPTTVDQPDKSEMKVDKGHEKQAPPPIAKEMPRTVVPIEEKPSPIQSPAAKPAKQKPSLSQSSSEKSKAIMPGERDLRGLLEPRQAGDPLLFDARAQRADRHGCVSGRR